MFVVRRESGDDYTTIITIITITIDDTLHTQTLIQITKERCEIQMSHFFFVL